MVSCGTKTLFKSFEQFKIFIKKYLRIFPVKRFGCFDNFPAKIFTNVAILQEGELFTPPIKCGLLGGTYRKKLLEEGLMKEKILYPKDLKTAEKIFCFNSVRKMVEVELC